MKITTFGLLACFVFASNDSLSQWIRTNVPQNEWVTTLAVGTNALGDTILLAGTYGDGVFLLNSNGDSYTAINNGLTNKYISSLVFHGTSLFAGTYGGGVFHSTNDGSSWAPINTGLVDTTVWCLAMSGSSLFAGTASEGVFLSTNDGNSWSAINSGLTNTMVSALAVNPYFNGDTIIFVGTVFSGVFRSSNNGTNWTVMDSGLTTMNVTSFAVGHNQTGSTTIFAGTYGGGVFLSTNDGTNWSAADSGLTAYGAPVIFDLVFIPDRQGSLNLYAGTDDGVYRSTSGVAWSPIKTGGMSNNIRALEVYRDYLFASANGLWRRPLSEMLFVSKTSLELPQTFRLCQNYPNPFNSTTIISFSIPSKARVSLKIFDNLGRDLSILISEEMDAGVYTKQWEANGLSSGIYFYRLQSGSFTETKKLILLR